MRRLLKDVHFRSGVEMLLGRIRLAQQNKSSKKMRQLKITSEDDCPELFSDKDRISLTDFEGMVRRMATIQDRVPNGRAISEELKKAAAVTEKRLDEVGAEFGAINDCSCRSILDFINSN